MKLFVMKKLLLIGLVLAMAQVSFAQGLGGIFQRLSFGLKAGGNYSNFTGANFDTEGLAGFNGGLLVNFKLTDKWSVQEEFLYSMQGAKITDNVFGTHKDLKLSYMSVPILVKYRSAIGLYAEVGAQANLLMKDAKDTGFVDFADKIDAGAVAGLGYEFTKGPAKGLGLGARYYQGFRDVGKFNSTTLKSDFKNSVAQLSIFYMF
jgi:hypothetical protein